MVEFITLHFVSVFAQLISSRTRDQLFLMTFLLLLQIFLRLRKRKFMSLQFFLSIIVFSRPRFHTFTSIMHFPLVFGKTDKMMLFG